MAFANAWERQMEANVKLASLLGDLAQLRVTLDHASETMTVCAARTWLEPAVRERNAP